jgi:hypothetical protein
VSRRIRPSDVDVIALFCSSSIHAIVYWPALATNRGPSRHNPDLPGFLHCSKRSLRMACATAFYALAVLAAACPACLQDHDQGHPIRHLKQGKPMQQPARKTCTVPTAQPDGCGTLFLNELMIS